MTVLTATIFVLAALGSASAHGDARDAASIAWVWTYDSWIIIPLCTSAALYLIGTRRIWHHAGHGRGVRHWQVVSFWCGWTCLALALLSPLHWLGERLFVAHMIEHEVLMVVAAPLLAVARPIGAFLWALPPRWRAKFRRAAQVRLVSNVWAVLRNPLMASVLHGAALWVWHMPILYNSVLAHIGMHRLQHACFFFSAVLFWWSLFFGPLRQRGYGIAVGCLFFTSLHSAILGILLTLARQPWYPQQDEFAALCGLTALEDQQLAGLVMWVPPGLIYLGFAIYFAARWISQAGTSYSRGGRYAIASR
jgi:cytochrome c oxidase assembly factor CtaG